MKLLLDQGLPRSAASLLRAAGIDTVHTGEIGLATTDDESIIQVARQEERIVVTLDADFHALLALSGADKPSVVRIRIEGLRAEPLATLLQALLEERGSELDKGALMTVQPKRIRIRFLPIIPKL
jgi:predicted nuclease of predicted toxin-antitoxin system